MKQPFAKGFFVGGATSPRRDGDHRQGPDPRRTVGRGTATPQSRCRSGTPSASPYCKPDGKYTFDKLSSVYVSGNATRDDAPNHVRVRKNVLREIAETWAWMCPAGVYEIPDDAPESGPST